MKALVCVEHGPPEKLVVQDLPAPEPGKGEVRIRMHAAGVNFPDVLIIQNLYQFKPPLPFSPGGEAAGVVDAVGEGVSRYKVGDRVIVPGTPQCGVCYMCLQGRADFCQFLGTSPVHPVAQMSDGTPVFEDASLGGIAELMVVPEEYTCPVFTSYTLSFMASGTNLVSVNSVTSRSPSTSKRWMFCSCWYICGALSP